jgi:hypothetical protein
MPQFLDNQLIDGGMVVSFKRRPHFNPQKGSQYSFLLEVVSLGRKAGFFKLYSVTFEERPPLGLVVRVPRYRS